MASAGLVKGRGVGHGGGSWSGVVKQFGELVGEIRSHYAGVGVPSVVQLPMLRLMHRQRLILKQESRKGVFSPDVDFMRESLRMLQVSGATYVRRPIRPSFGQGDSPLTESEMIARRASLDSSDVVRANLHSGELGPYVPGHFVALDHSSKSLIIAIRGTKNLADVYTNLVCKPWPYLSGSAHGGMARSAIALWKALRKLVPRVLPDGYEVRFVGHSAGGGIALLAALFLLCQQQESKMLRKSKVSCWAFAAPPVFSSEKRLPLRVRKNMHCFINQDDVVPTLSFARVAKVLHSLSELRKFEWKTKLQALRSSEEFEKLSEEVQELESMVQWNHLEDFQIPGNIYWMWGEDDCRLVKPSELSDLIISDTMIHSHMIGAYARTMQTIINRLEDKVPDGLVAGRS